MNQVHPQINQLIDDISNYFRQQQEIYGNEFYTNYDIDNLALDEVEIKEKRLSEFFNQIKQCQKCELANSRRHVVFGKGNPDAEILLIGEAPGSEEDQRGEPFVGAAGQLLTKILAAINLDRDDVYITNIVKCRPPQNRDPLPEEQEACRDYLQFQLNVIKPRFILALGRIAAQALLNSTQPIGQLRGKAYDFENCKLIATYHPAALLRNPELKRDTWHDVQLLQQLYLDKEE